jgi:hypothetical protein
MLTLYILVCVLLWFWKLMVSYMEIQLQKKNFFKRTCSDCMEPQLETKLLKSHVEQPELYGFHHLQPSPKFLYIVT